VCRLHRRCVARTFHVCVADFANECEDAYRRRPVGGRIRRHLRFAIFDPLRRGPTPQQFGHARRALHHRRVLVHVLHFLCQPRRYACPLAKRYVCRHSSSERIGICRSAVRGCARGLEGGALVRSRAAARQIAKCLRRRIDINHTPSTPSIAHWRQKIFMKYVLPRLTKISLIII
jgi:hypothetical protein